MEVIKKGDHKKEVQDVQARLKKLGYSLGPAGVDGIFGERTKQAVKNFQQDRGLDPTGEVAEETWRHLLETTYNLGERLLYLKTPFLKGDDVKRVQRWLNTLGFPVGVEDAIFGPDTEQAVRAFQKNSGIVRDGIVGPETLRAFNSLQRILESNSSVDYPQKQQPSSISILKGKKIAIDFEPLKAGPAAKFLASQSSGEPKDDPSRDVALRLGNLLEILGGAPMYAFTGARPKSIDERARFANRNKAHIFVSVGLNSSSHPDESGSTTYYFASKRKLSEVGRRLAGSIQQEMVTLLRRKDLGSRGASLPLLKKTKMPAVLVVPAYVTNSQEKDLLREENFRQKVAIAIFDGLKNFLENKKTK